MATSPHSLQHNQKPRSPGRRGEDLACCPNEGKFEEIADAHKSMAEQLAAIKSKTEENGAKLDDIAGAFVDTDFTRHRSMQKAEIDAADEAKAMRRHVKFGLALAAAILASGFILMAVWTRIVMVSVPAAQTQGATK